MKVFFLAALLALGSSLAGANKITLDENGVLEVDGKKTFVISVAVPPLPGAKTPDDRDAFAQLKDDGVNFMRIRPTTGALDFSQAGVRSIGAWLDAAAAQQLHCWITLGHLPTINPADPADPERQRLLRLAIELYKDHPATGGWKGYDEAAWVKMPVERLVPVYKLFKELDPNHPVIMIQAPTKKSLPLEPYADVGDIMGVDIFPITYPPGKHSDFGNPEISVVADCAQWISAASHGKPIWMTLQIAWGGTATPGKTLRFPTFPQERYMVYAAIINGARGVNFQGGERPLSLNERDAKLGWNWTFWQKVMQSLIAEIRESSPLHPALLAANSKLPIKLEGADDIDFCVREVGDDLFLLAAKREGETVKVTFRGLPLSASTGAVLFEEPRKVTAKDGAFEDWFAPNEVHVYCFHRTGGAQ